MNFKLNIDGQEKTFTVPFVKGRILRNALKINKSLSKKEGIDEETIDLLVAFVCDVFNNQFTPDDVLDGLPLKGMIQKLQGVLFDVVTEATSGIDGVSDPKNE